MLFVIGLLALALLFLVPVGVSLRSSGRSRRHSDSLLVGLFAGPASVGLVSARIAVITFLVPEILTTGVGFLTTFGRHRRTGSHVLANSGLAASLTISSAGMPGRITQLEPCAPRSSPLRVP